MKFKFILFVISFQIIEILTNKIIKKNDNNESVKFLTKRGAIHFGDGVALTGSYPGFYGYQTPIGQLQFGKFPFGLKGSTHGLFVGQVLNGSPYTLRHGGAVVTSYNANYPQYPLYSQNIRPLHQLPFHGVINPLQHVQPISPPHVAVHPANPIIPVSSSSVVNNFAIPQRPFIPVPIAQRPIITSLNLSPGSLSAYPIGYPQTIVPVSVAAGLSPTVPKTFPTPTIPTPTNILPTQSWRPIIINSPPPSLSPPLSTPTTIGTPSNNRPAISLLPPTYGQHLGHHNQGNLNEFHIQEQDSNNNNQQFNDHHHFIHGQQQHNIQQQIEQHQQQQQLFEAHESGFINEQNNLNSNNHGNYFGESSYDVPLQSNKGYHY